MKPSLLLTGIGLRAPHYQEMLEKRPGVAWLEVHSENFFGEGGHDIAVLEELHQHYPISFHGVSLSIGSADELNWHHLKKLRDLCNRISPCLISDHLAWSSIDGQYLHDLLPLPYTEEALNHVVLRIQQIQDYLQRQILIENITQYIQFNESIIPEAAFLKEVATQAQCGILLDINNLYINSRNLDTDPEAYILQLPKHAIQELHLGGFAISQLGEKEILIDSHSRAIVPAVWDLYRFAVAQLGRKPTIIEWDNDLPTLDTLYLEAYRAEKILKESYVAAQPTG